MTLILVAEDDPFIRRFIATVAEQAGWETTLTENGARAWAAFETDPDAFDVVVTDVRMPVVSGLELAERIRRVSSITILSLIHI